MHTVYFNLKRLSKILEFYQAFLDSRHFMAIPFWGQTMADTLNENFSVSLKTHMCVLHIDHEFGKVNMLSAHP
jgi:hypothetical protein